MLVTKNQVAVVTFNMQLEIIPLLENGSTLLNDCRWLADVCHDLKIPHLITEHKKLGALSASLKEVAGDAHFVEKEYFDFTRHETIVEKLNSLDVSQIVLAGAETHVCLYQSAVSLMKQGKTVFLLSDTCSARNLSDHTAALKRFEQLGVQLITREMFFFELLEHSELPRYLELAMKYLDGRYIR